MLKSIRVLIIGDANSSHTFKWVTSLSKSGIIIGLWSLSEPRIDLYKDVAGITLGFGAIKQKRKGISAKLKYLTVFGNLKAFAKKFKPDIVHAHYASSYGLLGRLINFHPYVISVWGSDVFDFPNKNFVTKNIIINNLKNADHILSTGNVMALETKKYTNKNILVTPFGVDLEKFYSKQNDNSTEIKPFVVGTIKSLEEIYGIKYLMKAFSIFRSKYANDAIKLYIVGGGSQESFLKKLAIELGIERDCVFTGAIPFSQVALYHRKMDISVFLSNMESFGVSAIEASASGNPVIVSDVGGLPEVIENNVTGIVVPPRDPESAAIAMEELFKSKDRRDFLGINGRKRVEELYDWDKNVLQMVEFYYSILR
jgi:glycosyltransferase involved in cell wall biosynthesis